MPCQSYDDGNSYAEATAATRAACELAKVARSMGASMWGKMAGKLSNKTLAWIEEHDALDVKREAEEKAEAERQAARKAALHKLTSKERQALNIR